MVEALRRLIASARARTATVALLAAVAVPLLWSGASAVAAAGDSAAWRALLDDPQVPRAAALSLATGAVSTLLSIALTASILSRAWAGPAWPRLVRLLAPMLAVPHAAFAIGIAFLLAPSGWVLRALSPWATGFDAPPPWPTTQDPWGLGLVLVLVLKETPFLLWSAVSQLQRPDQADRWRREAAVARSLGYDARGAWRRVVWPQLLPRLIGPIAAVTAYAVTVVDMALVIGPTSPPTLAVLAWNGLLDADAAVNAQGAAAAWLLAALAATCVAPIAWTLRSHRRASPRLHDGRRTAAGAASDRRRGGTWPVIAIAAPSLAVLLSLAVGSVAGVWPFPALWPERLTAAAWLSVAASAGTIATTFALATVAGVTALVWTVAWLEWAPTRLGRRFEPFVLLPLIVPSVLWVVGLHGLSLAWRIDGSPIGLWLAHSLAALPYVLIALAPAWRNFDPRLAHVGASLGRSRLAFWWRVKLPLLKAPVAAAFAVGFAVSVAQYLPTLFVGAGRYATVTTEAVTLASGAQRSLTAAYAWLQWLLPVTAFALAARAGRPRRFPQSKPRAGAIA